MTREEQSGSYVIIRYNIRTYRSAGVVEVVKGKQVAESTVRELEACQDPADRHEGWRYLIHESDLPPGTNPAEATLLRQKELDTRESKAMRENSIVPPDSE